VGSCDARQKLDVYGHNDTLIPCQTESAVCKVCNIGVIGQAQSERTGKSTGRVNERYGDFTPAIQSVFE
jgi:hypothetical protein